MIIEMKKLLQMAAAIGVLSVLAAVPDFALSQTTVNLNVVADDPAPGLTAVYIQIKTEVVPNTFGSATVDVRYDAAVHDFHSAGAGVLATHNTDFQADCVTHFENDALPPNCSEFPPYAFQAVEELFDGTSDYVRFSVTGANVGETIEGFTEPDLLVDGYEVGNSFVSLRRLVFQPASPSPGGPALSKQAVVGFEIEPSSLSIGFFDSPDNSNETGVIIDQCGESIAALGCSIEGQGELPVELSGFSAVTENGEVVLNWTTSSETNNAGFSVEHAAGDEGTFEEVTFVDGAGTSFEARTYTYTVKGLDVGTHRFRLKQLDYDGSFEYSSVVEASIELAGTHRLGAAYPNPFNPSTTFELVVGREQHVKIDVINALGQRVQRLFDGSMEANKPTNFTFEARNLPTGLYFYRAVGENFAQTRQALLVK